MKKTVLAAAIAAVALTLAACESTQPGPGGPPPVIEPDKTCTHPDGKPC